MEERLIKLPYVEVESGIECVLEHPSNYIVRENNILSLRSTRPDMNGRILFDTYIPIDPKIIVNENFVHTESEIEDFKKQLNDKDKIISKLKIELEENLRNRKDISKLNDELSKQNAELKEQLIMPKLNGCCEWVSGKTLVEVVKELTKK